MINMLYESKHKHGCTLVPTAAVNDWPAQARAQSRSGDSGLRKIVLARRSELRFQGSVDPLRLLEGLQVIASLATCHFKTPDTVGGASECLAVMRMV